MNQPTQDTQAETLLGTKFIGFIKTDILLKDGREAQIVTMYTTTGMFEEIAAGISRGLKSNGMAAEWQHRVYSVRGGILSKPIVFERRRAEQQAPL